MYGGKGGVGATTVASGAIVLPNTGGNTVLTVVSIVFIAIGSAIILSILAKYIAKRAYTRA